MLPPVGVSNDPNGIPVVVVEPNSVSRTVINRGEFTAPPDTTWIVAVTVPVAGSPPPLTTATVKLPLPVVPPPPVICSHAGVLGVPLATQSGCAPENVTRTV